MTLVPNWTFLIEFDYLITRGFHRSFATDVTCQLRTPGYICPPIGLAFVLMLLAGSPKFVLFPDFEFRTSLGTSILPYSRGVLELI